MSCDTTRAGYARVGVGTMGCPATIEVDIRPGLPAFTILGLRDAAVRETRERVRAALLNSGHEFPLQRITATITPPRCRKAAGHSGAEDFTLGFALALLGASAQVPTAALSELVACAGLSLSGVLRPAPAASVTARRAEQDGYTAVVLALADAADLDAGAVGRVVIVGAPTLYCLARLLSGGQEAQA